MFRIYDLIKKIILEISITIKAGKDFETASRLVAKQHNLDHKKVMDMYKNNIK